MPVQNRVKGVKGQPNTPTTEYGELKRNVKMTLTPTAIGLLDAEAKEKGISRSELIERKARVNLQQKLDELMEKLETLPIRQREQLTAIVLDLKNSI